MTLTPGSIHVAVTACFYDLGLSRRGFEHPTSRMQGEHSLEQTAPPQPTLAYAIRFLHMCV